MTQIHSVKQYLSKRVKEFKAGNIQCCVKTWSEITSDDSEILQVVKGAKIECSSTPHQPFCPRQCFSGAELDVIDQEIARLHAITRDYSNNIA